MTEVSKTSVGHLTLTGLEKVFSTKRGEFRALDGVSLDIAPGEFITLLGPSGCGKTTTLRIIAGFETPTYGEVTLDGKSILAVTPDKRPMAMVFQSYALFPHMNVYDNVAYGLRIHKVPPEELKERVAEALAMMDLTALADRSPSQMSGGQQQRVALARAMVMRPVVLLFDEPLSNLDAKLRVAMRTEIRNLQRKLGITSVYVTHDQDEAMSMADRIVIMNKGKIEQADTSAEIYRHPASKFVADFIGRANFLTVTSVKPSAVAGKAKVVVFGEELEVAASAAALDEMAGGAPVPMVLLVRPETVRLTRPAASEHAVAGRIGKVTSAVFYGDLIEYVIESAHGPITAVVSDPEVDAVFKVGEYARIDFEVPRVWLLPAEGQDAYAD